jgi:predicted metal-dependent phosphoesterase TrpH
MVKAVYPVANALAFLLPFPNNELIERVVVQGGEAMQPSFAAVRERYLEDLIEHQWYDVRTFGKKQRSELTTPGYLLELLQHGQVTAVEMHSHTPRSDGLIEPERIASWTNALYKKGYFRYEHLEVPLVVMITDHDYIYEYGDLCAITYDDSLRFLSATEVSTEHGHVLYYGWHPEIVYTYELYKPQLSVKPSGPELFDMVTSLNGGVAIPAHPFRETSILRELPGDDVAPLLTALEILNGKTPADQNLCAIEYAKKYGLRGVGGSDAHQMSRLYSYLTLFDGPIRSVDDLVSALHQGDFFPVHGEHLRFKPEV